MSQATSPTSPDQRRKLVFKQLEQAIQEGERLTISGYTRCGNWTLGQICHHLRVTQDASSNGYPRWMIIGLPLRPILRWFMLDKLLRGDSPAGVKTAGIFIPPDSCDDRAEFEKYKESVQRFQGHSGPLHAHPGFGRFTHAEFEQFHAAHAAHHLGFLLPVDGEESKTEE